MKAKKHVSTGSPYEPRLGISRAVRVGSFIAVAGTAPLSPEGKTVAPDAAQRFQLAIRWKSLRRDVPAADLSDGTLRFLFLITVLGSPSPPPLIAIDEPETGLHPSMFPIIAEFARDAADRTQVIFTTHSDQFLSAFRDVQPTTTVAKWVDGETALDVVDDESLAYWLEKYSLGELYRTGELEQMD